MINFKNKDITTHLFTLTHIQLQVSDKGMRLISVDQYYLYWILPSCLHKQTDV